jgi:2-polyprenyl-6-methoxyphenol hydroxylase-like FAD-dependent oxidoreductase
LVDSLQHADGFYFDEMSQVTLPRWSAGRVVLLGDAAFGPSPLSGQGTSLALIGAYLLAHQLGDGGDVSAALSGWEASFRANVAENQRLAAKGMSALLPASRPGILLRNQTLRLLPVLARLGLGFGGQLERASRAVTLPPVDSDWPACQQCSPSRRAWSPIWALGASGASPAI